MSFDIEFVNHASVLVRYGDMGLLTDPWYKGDVFHKGWNLLVETEDAQAAALLENVTHIWVSHEHPDHFSPRFFKSHGDQIRTQGITILFQQIDDQRVVDFLRANEFLVQELAFEKSYSLGEGFSVTCLKDGFYDAALSIRAGEHHILNLNDCAVTSTDRAQDILQSVGTCDVLLTQFSYAAWKGGKDNKEWRLQAAQQKLNNVAVQAEVLKPKILVPFASFVLFSNQQNFYLNDAVNTPEVVQARFRDADFKLAIMTPGDHITTQVPKGQTDAAIAYWQQLYDGLKTRELNQYTPVSEDRLMEDFKTYRTRVFKNNAGWFIRVMQRLGPLNVFQPIRIYLSDLGQGLEVDLAGGKITRCTGDMDLAMQSESLSFLFCNSFGFDTLAVNGCFEERQQGGFGKAAKSLAIENLNNLGVAFTPAIIFERKILSVFFGHMKTVRTRMAARKS